MKLEELTKILKENVNVFIMFSAEWCGPCKRIKPIVNEKKLKNTNLTFILLDIDQNDELAMYFKIKSIPTMIIFQNKKEIGRLNGNLIVHNIDKYIDYMNTSDESQSLNHY